MARSDKYTSLTNKPSYYSDFSNNLDVNPATGFLAKITNENAVKNSIKNIILTINGERFFQSTIGSKINALLFEPMDSPTAIALENTISEAIKNNEPRANLKSVELYPDQDRNAYLVTIIFSIINIPEDITFNFFLNRVR
jgi:phage baseplate assembly protein W